MNDLEDGIYLNLDESEYHALPRLSSTGICNLIISPATFWAKSWMNPDRQKVEEEGDEAEEEKATKVQIAGRAWHAARLEPEKFATTYVRDIDPGDYPRALMTGKAIEEQLELLGEAKTKKGESVLDKAVRLKATGYGGPIWHILRDQFDRETEGKIQLPAKMYDEITRDMGRIKDVPEIAKHLIGGAAEVSILWTNAKGDKCKARVDYLRPDERTDFKTFDNARGKELETCIVDAIRYNRYYIQAAFYDEAAEAIRIGGLKIVGKASDEERDLIDAIKEQPRPLKCVYIFQEKNGIPNLLAREIRLYSDPHESHAVNDAGADETISAKVADMTIKPTALMMKAQTEIRHASGIFRFYMDEVGDRAPWGPLRPTGEINDDNFSRYWLDGEQ